MRANSSRLLERMASVSNELDVRVRLIDRTLDKPNDLLKVSTSL